MSQSVNSENLARRRYPRRKFRREVGILNRGFYEIMTCVDLGEGGIGFISELALKLGDRILVSFAVDSGLFISVRCVIRNTRRGPQPGSAIYGCEFQGMSFENKRAIRAFVTARLSLEH